MVVLALHREVAKALHVVRLATHKLLVSLYAVVGVELLAKTLAAKHMVTVLPNFVFCPPTLIPYSNNMNFSHEPALNTCWSRCQQMSICLHVLFKADPGLEGDVAQGEADPSACLQLGQVTVFKYF